MSTPFQASGTTPPPQGPSEPSIIEAEIFLTQEVDALIRLPVSLATMAKLTRVFPKHRVQQRGTWLCLISPS